MKNINSILRTQILLLLVVVGAGTAYSQVNRSTISGFVFDTDRRPVAQVVVELKSDFSTVGRMRTDGSGRFFFTGLPHGRYTIRVIPMGTPFLEQSEDVEIAGIGVRGQSVTDNVQKDVYLKPRRGADAIPFRNEVIYAQEVPKEAETLYKRAVEDLESERVQTGIEYLEKAVSVFPEYFMALQRLGYIRMQQGRFDEAIQIYDKALEINTRCFDCMYGLSYSKYTIRKFEEAKRSAEQAVSEKPASMEAQLLLGMCLRMTKEFDKSETALKQAAKIADGTSAEVHWHLALLYGKDMNRFADAARELESYLKVAPEVPNKEEIKKLIRQFKEKAKTGA